MGFNNDGVKLVGERLREWKNQRLKIGNRELLIGGNIGKNKLTPNEDAWKDYEICFKELLKKNINRKITSQKLLD